MQQNEFKLLREPRIAAIGGGTGMSTLLRGLKHITSQLTAIVTVCDDGGSSGMLREDLGILPPGDIRNCIVALSHSEPIMKQLMSYRFTEGSLKGQCFGNIFIAAMSELSGGFFEAVKKTADVLSVTGRVLPVSLDNIHLCAKTSYGQVIIGESNIGMAQKNYGGYLQRVWLDKMDVSPLPEVITTLLQADVIVLGPGSLYTSIIPNLLIPGVCEAIVQSSAKKVYISNIMTQPGETEGYDAMMHLDALQTHSAYGLLDYIVVNSNHRIPPEMLSLYHNEGADIVYYDPVQLSVNCTELIEEDLLYFDEGKVRHDYMKLAGIIERIYLDNVN